MRRSAVFPAIFPTVLASLSVVPAARAGLVDFHLVSHSVQVDHVNSIARFSLTFDQPPQFTADGANSSVQEDAFQYEIDADRETFETPIVWSDVDTVVRGGEIFEGNGIPVRDRDGAGGDNSGGYGPIRALVPFEIEGNTLTFATGLSALGDDDGKFRYRLITTDGGGLTSQVNGAVIPPPPAVWSGIIMLGGIGVALAVRNARARRRVL